jgi:hypothetical protein
MTDFSPFLTKIREEIEICWINHLTPDVLILGLLSFMHLDEYIKVHNYISSRSLKKLYSGIIVLFGEELKIYIDPKYKKYIRVLPRYDHAVGFVNFPVERKLLISPVESLEFDIKNCLEQGHSIGEIRSAVNKATSKHVFDF